MLWFQGISPSAFELKGFPSRVNIKRTACTSRCLHVYFEGTKTLPELLRPVPAGHHRRRTAPRSFGRRNSCSPSRNERKKCKKKKHNYHVFLALQFITFRNAFLILYHLQDGKPIFLVTAVYVYVLLNCFQPTLFNNTFSTRVSCPSEHGLREEEAVTTPTPNVPKWVNPSVPLYHYHTSIRHTITGG